MKYRDLSKEEFDAIVTGELTHHAIWLESELVEIISNYFLGDSSKKADFNRLLFRRDGLTFQDKIEIVRGMLPLFKKSAVVEHLKKLLLRIEEFKKFRNAFAHGIDAQSDKNDKLCLKIERISQSGKTKTIEVTPETHEKQMESLERLFNEVHQVCLELK